MYRKYLVPPYFYKHSKKYSSRDSIPLTNAKFKAKTRQKFFRPRSGEHIHAGTDLYLGFALTQNKLNFSFLLALVIVTIKVKFTSFRYRYQVTCNCIPGVDLDLEENCLSVNVCSALLENFEDV
jgi:hypothetical protein